MINVANFSTPDKHFSLLCSIEKRNYRYVIRLEYLMLYFHNDYHSFFLICITYFSIKNTIRIEQLIATFMTNNTLYVF